MTVQSDTGFSQVYLAFDIHDVLAEQKADKISAPLFQAYGMLLQVPVEGHSKPIRHYVYPFVKELFQLLSETPGMHIAFSTSSKEIFAKPFVKQLLINTLGQEGYAKIADKVRICAKEQLRHNNTYKEVPHSRHSRFGNNRKDLDDVYPNPDIPKKQRVLIEDDSSYAAPHQVKSLLNVSGWHWTEKLERYQYSGYGLYFFSSYEEFEKNQYKIEPGESIALSVKQVIDKEGSRVAFVIVYHNEEGKQELELSLEESTKIKELYEKAIRESTTYISKKHFYKDNQKAIVDEIKISGLEKFSDSENSRLIIVCGEGVSPQSCMEKASRGDIAIHLSESDANIYFPQNPEAAVSLKNHGSLKLIKLVREYWESECKNKKYFSKERGKEDAKAQLYDIIWDKVKDLVWKEEIIPQANHILLLTGAIFNAWEESKATQKSINKILFNWQCEGEKEGKKFTSSILQNRTELYLKGLELLRKVNPHLEPITIKSFESALEKHPTLPEDGAKEHEDGCVIS